MKLGENGYPGVIEGGKSRNRGQNRIFLLDKILSKLTYFLYFYLFNLNSFGKSIISCTGFVGAVDA
jgi:hypothetical protein